MVTKTVSEIKIRTKRPSFLVYKHSCKHKAEWLSPCKEDPCLECKPEEQTQEVVGQVTLYLDKEGFLSARLPLKIRE